MAEIFSVAGVAITVPGILSGAWTVLTAAYNLYGSVEMRRTQIGLLLDRCRDLIEKIAQRLPSDTEDHISATMKTGINDVQKTCEAVKDILEKLKRKGFLWCMVNQDKIDSELYNIQTQIILEFETFSFVAHVDRDRFQEEIRNASQQDHIELVAKLDRLSSNDQQILEAIRDQGGAQRRVEELLAAVMKCVETLQAGTERTPEAKFLRSAGDVLQRMSKGRPQKLSEDWMITSLEVDFDSSNAVGQGSFGQVFKGQWNGVLVAIKQMYVEDARTLTEADRKAMYKEVKLWTTLHHPNILNLYGACLEATMPFLVMQYYNFGNLCSFLRRNPSANRIDLSYDVVAGMTYLHKRGIVHADLKGVNILVDDKCNALVADFGLSQAIDGIRSQSASTHAGGARGTLRWMAPECIDGEPATKASDVYSLGVTLWEIFSDEVPYSNIVDRLIPRQVVDRQVRPARPSRPELQDAVWDLIQRCWVHEPAPRPSISAVQKSLEHYTTRLGLRNQASQPYPAYNGHYLVQGPSMPLPLTPNVDASPTTTINASQLETAWTRSVRSRPPTWKRGSPQNYIDQLTIPEVPTDKQYQYRVVKGDTNLGIQSTYQREANGSQRVNLLEYNKGRGIADEIPIKVYAVDPDEEEGENEALVASWSPV